MNTATRLGSVVFALVSGFSTAGCARSTEAPTTLDTCVVGAWLGADRACGECVVGATAECGQPDCIESSLLLVSDDGREIEVMIRRLETQRRFSAYFGSVSPLLESTWVINDAGEFVITRSDGSVFASAVGCDATTFRRLGSLYGRPSVALETALFAAWEDGLWADRTW